MHLYYYYHCSLGYGPADFPANIPDFPAGLHVPLLEDAEENDGILDDPSEYEEYDNLYAPHPLPASPAHALHLEILIFTRTVRRD